MTPCPQKLDALMDADVATLRGDDDSPLAAHIAHCPRCADAARRILSANEALGGWLDDHPALDVDAVLSRAEAEKRPPAPRPGTVKRWMALAAAASVATLLLVRGVDPPLPGESPVAPGAPYATFEVPAGSNVAVLATDDPNITVLWLF